MSLERLENEVKRLRYEVETYWPGIYAAVAHERDVLQREVSQLRDWIEGREDRLNESGPTPISDPWPGGTRRADYMRRHFRWQEGLGPKPTDVPGTHHR